MNTTRLVEPAEMNGNGTPVGGMLPDTTAIFTSIWTAMTDTIPLAR